MLLLLLRLKIKYYKILHWNKTFEINIIKKLFLMKTENFWLNKTLFALLIIESYKLKILLLSIKLIDESLFRIK